MIAFMRRAKHDRTGIWFIAPATIHLFLFALFPIFYALYLSLFKWDILRDSKPFVGLKNYADTLANASFWNSIWNSAKYALLSVPAGMVVALAVALLISQRIRGVTLFRTLYYIPAIASGVATAMLWIYVFLPTQGLINTSLSGWNWLVEKVGLASWQITTATDFLNDAKFALAALAFMSIWTGLGPRMILYLAGLLAIPPSLYEAASIDGAHGWRVLTKITIPMLAPTTLFVLVTSTIAAFQMFTPVYMMTKGGPLDSTDVAGYHIYNEAWSKFHIGSASAQSFVLLAILMLVSILQFRLMRQQLLRYSTEG